MGRATLLLPLCMTALCVGLAAAGPALGPLRTAVAKCPPPGPNQQAAPASRCRGNFTWTHNFTIAELKNLVENACVDATIKVQPLTPGDVTINVLTDQNVRVMNRGIRLVAPTSRLTIHFKAANPPDTCRFSVAASNVLVEGVTFAGKAGACVCNTATGVSFERAGFSGSFGNLRVEKGATVAAINRPTCQGAMEAFCIVNQGRIDVIQSAAFAGSVKGGALINLGTVGNLTGSTFTNMNGAGGGPCVAANGIVVNGQGATIGRIQGSTFQGVIDGARAIWNDGVITGGIFTSQFLNSNDGAIGNGPTGFIKAITGNTFSTIKTSDAGGGLRNLGKVEIVDSNTFTDITSGNGGGVIAVTPDVGDLAVPTCNVTAFAAVIEKGIFNNRFTTFKAGDGCGAILVADGGRVGNWQSAWNAAASATYQPSVADRTNFGGILNNAFSAGSSSDNGVGICVRGQVSLILANSFNDLSTADSGGAIYVSRSVAYIGNNTVSNVQTDRGAGLLCSVPNWSALFRVPLASIRSARFNRVSGVQQNVEGGCFFIGVTCGVQFLTDNTCTTQAVPGLGQPQQGIVFETDPTGLTRNATVCTSANNKVNLMNNVLPRNLPSCPIKADGFWYNAQGLRRALRA